MCACFRVTPQKFLQYSCAIQELFPSENKEIYYFKTTYKHHKTGAGKLFRRFYNYRRSLKRSGLLDSKNEKESLVPLSRNSHADCTEQLQWLRNSSEPWRQVEEYWKLTFAVRYSRLRSTEEIQTIGEYLCEFPALKSRLGYTLVSCNKCNLKNKKVCTYLYDFS